MRNQRRPGIAAPTRRAPTPEQLYDRLPPDARRDLHEHWRRREGRTEQQRSRRRSQLIQSLVEGTSLFFLVQLVVYGLTWGSAIASLAIGLALGWTWHRLSPIPAVAGLTAIGGFLALRMICGMGGVFSAIIAMLLITCLSFAIAITRSAERMGV